MPDVESSYGYGAVTQHLIVMWAVVGLVELVLAALVVGLAPGRAARQFDRTDVPERPVDSQLVDPTVRGRWLLSPVLTSICEMNTLRSA